MKLSVILTTYNRKDILVGKTLPALEKQQFPKSDCEILIVDDGSTDGTADALSRIIPSIDLRIRLLEQRNSGPAAARNRAIKEASGEILLIMGDDTYPPRRDFLSMHYRHHSSCPEPNEAMVGLTVWDKSIETPFMAWLQATNKQFAYGSIETGSYVNYRRFYTSNLSLKREFITVTKEFLDERFKRAAYEDIEWGYRLQNKCGMRLFYQEEALLYHHHVYTQEEFLHRNVINEEIHKSLRTINNKLYRELTASNNIMSLARSAFEILFMNKYILDAIPSDVKIEECPKWLQRYIFKLMHYKCRTRYHNHARTHA